MNVYQLLEAILKQEQKISGTYTFDDHPATIEQDMRDEFIYIRISGHAIAIKPDGVAFRL